MPGGEILNEGFVLKFQKEEVLHKERDGVLCFVLV